MRNRWIIVEYTDDFLVDQRNNGGTVYLKKSDGWTYKAIENLERRIAGHLIPA